MGKSSGKNVLIVALAALLILFSLGPTPSQAAGPGSTSWQKTSGTGDWADPLNWDPVVPDSTVNVIIDTGGTALISASDAEALNLTLGQNVPASQPPQPSTVLHLDQTLTVGGTLTLGQEALGGSGSWQGSYGKYYMNDSGGGSPILSADSMIVSDLGYGVFLQQGGTVAVASNLILGNQVLPGDPQNWTYPFSGQYTMWRGATAPTLTVGGQLVVANAGYGGFEQYSGSVTATQGLVIGSQAGSHGYYFVENDAVLTVGQDGSTATATMYVGQGGSGYFSIDYYGGEGCDPYSFKVFGDLVVGGQTGSWGKVEQQSGKAVVTGNLTLGNQEYAHGEYSLFAGTYSDEWGEHTTGPASLTVGNNLIVGQSGNGSFSQEGGTVTVGQDLILGQQQYSYGDYYLFEGTDSGTDEWGSYFYSGGPASLTVGNNLIVGQSGNGSFSQEGGTVTVSQDLILGQQQNASGYYSLFSGNDSEEGEGWLYSYTAGPASLTVGGNLIVGQSGYGSFSQGGGTVAVNQDLILGQQGSNGYYSLSEISAYDEGGYHSSTNPAYLIVGGSLIVGDQGSGHFNQEGGAVLVDQDLILGQQGSSSGAYSLFQGTRSGEGEGGPYTYTTGPGSLMVGNSLHVGQSGSGSFAQEGGTVAVANDLILGQQAASSGDYSLFGGTQINPGPSGPYTDTTGPAYLTVGGSLGGSLIVGQTGSGSFSQEGGSNAVANDLVLGQDMDSNGNYSLLGGTKFWLEAEAGYHTHTTGPAYLTVGGSLIVGQHGDGSFTQEGGSVTVTRDLILAQQGASSGDYSLFGGTRTSDNGPWEDNYTYTVPAYLNVGGSLIVGQHGDGSFTQEGGSVTVNNDLILGQEEYAHGTYSLFAGTGEYANGEYVTYTTGPASLDVQGSLIIGNIWSGEFTQTGGTVTVGGPLILANGGTAYEGNNGFYSLYNGTLTVGQTDSPANMVVGALGEGNFYQENGELTVHGDLIAGDQADSYGYVEQYGGTATVNGNLIVGNAGRGSFYQDGGEVEVNGSLNLAKENSSEGNYSLSNGATLTVWGLGPTAMIVGAGGMGYFNQYNSELTAYGDVIVGDLYGSDGQVYQQFSNARVTGSLTVGNQGHGRFDQVDSSMQVDNNLIIAAGNGGDYTVTGGGLSASEVHVGAGGLGNLSLYGGGSLWANSVYVGESSWGYLSIDYSELMSGELVAGDQPGSHGEVSQTGGTAEVYAYLTLGNLSGSYGQYNLNDGSLTVGQVGSPTTMTVGAAGEGYFYQGGGSFTVNGDMLVGDKAGGSGLVEQYGGMATVTGDLILGNEWGESSSSGGYVMYAGGPSLEVQSNLIVGNAGIGDFRQEGGQVEVFGSLVLGDGATTSGGWDGVYNLWGGSLTVGSYGSLTGMIVGSRNRGLFTQSDGTLLVYGNLTVGDQGDSVGAVEHTGGTVTVADGDLVLGNERGEGAASGSYHLFAEESSVNSPSLEVNGSLIAGNKGNGDFIQEGGAVSVADGDLILGLEGWGNGHYPAIGSYSLFEGTKVGVDWEYTTGSASLEVSKSLVVGQYGSGSFTQKGGSVTVDQELIVAEHTSSSGTYSLFAGTGESANGEYYTYTTGPAVLNVLGDMYVGQAGTGTFTQSGGTVSTNHLEVGAMAGSSGLYHMSGGTLNVLGSDTLILGRDGASGSIPAATGKFTLLDGFLTVGQTGASTTMYVGKGGTGTFFLGFDIDTFEVGGNPTFTLYGDLVAGDQAGSYGRVFQFGSTATVTGNLTMGNQEGASGDYTLFGGTYSTAGGTYTSGPGNLTVEGSLIGGQSGDGGLSQAGGTVTVSQDLILGQQASSSGYLELIAGTLSGLENGEPYTDTTVGTTLNVGGRLIVGQNGTGSVDQDGGAVTVASDLILGQQASSHGSYDFFEGTGSGVDGDGPYSYTTGPASLDVQGMMTVGQYGQGEFTQSGGTLSVNGIPLYDILVGIIVGDQAGSIGKFVQDGGTATVKGWIGLGVAGADNTDPDNIIPAAEGKYTLLDGSLTVGQESAPTGIVVGVGGTGLLFLGADLNPPDYPGGSLEVGGNPTLNLYGDLEVGNEAGSSGWVLQFGSTATVTGNLTLGHQGAYGDYTLFKGTLVDSGGTHISNGPGSLTVGGSLIAGQAGSGGLAQTGGTVEVGQDLIIGRQGTSDGYYELFAGTESGVDEGGSYSFNTGPAYLNVGGSLIVGRDGTGSFDQNGGNVTVSNDLVLGQQPYSFGNYSIFQGTKSHEDSGGSNTYTTGTSTLTVGGSLIVGQAGSVAVFFQDGGSVTVDHDLILSQQQYAPGSYNLFEGTRVDILTTDPAYLNVGGSLIVGQAGPGSFKHEGGAATVASDLVLGDLTSSSGSYNLFGGTLSGVHLGSSFSYTTGPATLDVQGRLIVGQSGIGSFTQEGGTVTVTGVLTDDGLIGGILGQGENSSGSYAIFGGTKEFDSPPYGNRGYTTAGSSLDMQGSLIVGQAGTGSFAHDGGTVTVHQDLILGQQTSSSGTYSLFEGEKSGPDGEGSFSYTTDPAYLNVGGSLIVGQAGTGTFTQTGGSLTFGMGGQLLIGDTGSGAFTQTGGSVNFVSSPETTDYLKIGVNGGTGTYTLQGEANLSVDGMTIVGLASPGSTSGGTGYFSQDGGTHTIFRTTDPLYEGDGGRLLLGNRANTYGEYRLSGGLLEVGGKELLGLSEPGQSGGTGVFVQTGGTNTISGYTQPDGFGRLVAGWYDNSVGTYELQGGLFTPDRIFLGYTGENPIYPDQPLTSGKGTLTISGGDLVTQQIVVGWNADLGNGGFGLLELTSQNAHVETQGLYVNTTGIFTAAPGSVLNIANTFQNNSTNTQSSGNLTFGIAGQMLIGDTGSGAFTQTGGSVNFNSSTTNTNYLRLRVGANGGTGTYYLEDTATLTVDGMVWVGWTNNDTGGSGYFYQSGGTHSIFRTTDPLYGGDGGRLNLGSGQGTYGYYELSGGLLEVGGKVTLGMSAPGKMGGTGHFVQIGGTHTITGYTLPDEIGRMGVGIYDNTAGIYELHDGVFTADKIILGYDGTIIPGIYPDQPLASGQGTFTISGGSMAVKDVFIGWHENLGNGGFGLLELTGQNAHVEADNLSVGSQGIVTVAPGAILNIANDFQNNGTFTQSGGTLNSLQSMVLGQETGAMGSYSLQDGVVNAQYIAVGNSGQGTFTQSGGSLDSLGTMVLGQETGAKGSYSLQDGVVNAQYIAVGNSGQGTFTQSGGSLTVNNTLTVKEATGAGTFTQNGGDSNINNFVNYGTVQFNNLSNTEGSSAFIGAMDNYGEVRVTSSTITFGSYDEHGVYISDPSTTIIQTNLNVFGNGYLLGNKGDTWQIGNDFANASTRNADWNTRRATLVIFEGVSEPSHNIQLAGTDQEASSSGYLNNFAWGVLDLQDTVGFQGISLHGSGKALYVGEIRGADIVSGTVNNISGDLNIYYDLDLNRDVLNGGTYSFASGSGQLIPVPFVTTHWNADVNGDWHYAPFWSQGVPLSTEDVFLDKGLGAFIQNDNAVAQNLVVGDSNSGGVYKSGVTQHGHSLTVTYDLILGNYGGWGGYTQQSGGTVAVGQDLILGNLTPDSLGTYDIFDELSSLTVSRDLIVGHKGEGYFYHHNGTVTVGQDLILGSEAGSSGAYSLYEGSLTVGQDVPYLPGTMYVGRGGEGYLSMAGDTYYGFTGGNPTLMIYGNLVVGDQAGSVGNIYQYYGTATITGSVTLGNQPGSYGEYDLYGGSLTVGQEGTTSSTMYVGKGGEGYFYQESASLIVNGNMVVGDQAGSLGEVDQYGGTAMVLGKLILGNAGPDIANPENPYPALGIYGLADGSLTVGALHSTESNMVVGSQGAGYFLMGTDSGASTLTLHGNLVVGDQPGSVGGVFHAGGEATVNGNLSLGVQGPSANPSRLAALGGYLLTPYSEDPTSLTVTGNIEVGVNGIGGFYQTEGSVAANEVFIGRDAGGLGGYVMEGGTLNTQNLSVAFQATGGTFQLPAEIMTPLGPVSLQDAAQFFPFLNYLNIDYENSTYTGPGGNFFQTGGDISTNHVEVGVLPGSTGYYQMSGGSLNIAPDEDHIWDGALILGRDGATIDTPAAQGTFELSGAGILTAADIYVGGSGSGIFSQSGGTATVTRSLILGSQSGSYGNYNLYDGTLTVGEMGATDPVMTVGDGGEGFFYHPGGQVTVNGAMVLGNQAGSHGDYYLYGVPTVLEVLGDLIVGNYGGGAFNQYSGELTVSGNMVVSDQAYSYGNVYQEGGTATVTGGLSLGKEQYANGNYSLSAGTRTYDWGSSYSGPTSLGVDSMTVGQSGFGSFSQEGGTATVTGDLTLGKEQYANGQYSFFKGTRTYEYPGFSYTYTITTDPASLDVQGSLIVGQSGFGSFTQGGGTVTLNQDIILGQQASSSGSYSLLEGTYTEDHGYYSTTNTTGPAFLNVGGSHNLIVGQAGTGTFTQTGGSLTVGVGGQLYVGLTGSGTYIQNGGQVNLVSSESTTDYLKIGVNGGTGSYLLLGGSATLTVDGMTILGTTSNDSGGSGTFVQSGGTHSIRRTTDVLHEGDGGRLLLGNGQGTYGYYSLSGGQLIVGGKEILGLSETGYSGGTGVFVQTGGTNTITGQTQPDGFGRLVAGWYDNSSGTYEMSGGTFRADRIILGNDGPSTNPLYPTQTDASGQGKMTIGGNGNVVVQDLIVGNTYDHGHGGFGWLDLASQDAYVEVTRDHFIVGGQGIFTAVPGAEIHFAGTNFIVTSDNQANLAGFKNVKLIFTGGPGVIDTFELGVEVGSVEIGAGSHVHFVDHYDNNQHGSEVMQIDYLVLNPGATLDFFGDSGTGSEYVNIVNLILQDGAILNTAVLDQNDLPFLHVDNVTNATTHTPVPASLLLLGTGLLGLGALGWRRRRQG
jgi:hypothetical protein